MKKSLVIFFALGMLFSCGISPVTPSQTGIHNFFLNFFSWAVLFVFFVAFAFGRFSDAKVEFPPAFSK